MKAMKRLEVKRDPTTKNATCTTRFRGEQWI
jgi:hypothetical protein